MSQGVLSPSSQTLTHKMAALPSPLSFLCPHPASPSSPSIQGLLLMKHFLLAVLKPGGDSLIMRDLKTPPNENCVQSETESLLEKERMPSLEAIPTAHHSSLKQEPPFMRPPGSYAAWGLARLRTRGSFHSLRRVSSLDNFEATRSEFQRKCRERRANSGRGKTHAVISLPRGRMKQNFFQQMSPPLDCCNVSWGSFSPYLVFS